MPPRPLCHLEHSAQGAGSGAKGPGLEALHSHPLTGKSLSLSGHQLPHLRFGQHGEVQAFWQLSGGRGEWAVTAHTEGLRPVRTAVRVTSDGSDGHMDDIGHGLEHQSTQSMYSSLFINYY